MKYKISEYAKMNNVSIRTVWRWIERGELVTEKTPTGRVRIVIEHNQDVSVAVYARVSSSENKDNLERQKERLVNYCYAKGYKISKIITEIGSGLNDHRPKLEALLIDDSIKIIVVEHKDRFARFGTNFIQKLLSTYGRSLEIVNPVEDDESDIMQDFVSIVTSFCSRIYGKRRSKRKVIKIIEEVSKCT